MKNEQLLLKTLCSGLPYGLKLCRIDRIYDLVISNRTFSFLNGVEIDDVLKEEINGFKPILYDLSYLTKPIWHKGEKIVPLQLLNEMRGVSVESKEYKYDVFEDNEYWCYWGDKKYYGFSFEKQTMSFYNIGSAGISPQLELFEKLDELHIDYRGLIDLGLAVIVDTLKENPYKR